MSVPLELQNWLKSLPASGTLSGYFLMMDSEGNLSRVPVNRIANVVILNVNTDMDANNCRTSGCTVYTSSGDMRTHTALYDNFPKKPEGGFTMIALKEGGRVRHIWMGYNSSLIYERHEVYSNVTKGSVWTDWRQVANV